MDDRWYVIGLDVSARQRRRLTLNCEASAVPSAERRFRLRRRGAIPRLFRVIPGVSFGGSHITRNVFAFVQVRAMGRTHGQHAWLTFREKRTPICYNAARAVG
jgi:hypothetical protein